MPCAFRSALTGLWITTAYLRLTENTKHPGYKAINIKRIQSQTHTYSQRPIHELEKLRLGRRPTRMPCSTELGYSHWRASANLQEFLTVVDFNLLAFVTLLCSLRSRFKIVVSTILRLLSASAFGRMPPSEVTRDSSSGGVWASGATFHSFRLL